MKKSIRYITLTAVFAALCFAGTVFTKINIFNGQGYVHFGDSVIFIAACVLPLRYAIFVGAIGAGFADLITGNAIWLIFTLVIKAVMAIGFNNKGLKIISLRNVLVSFVSSVVGIIGYYFAEVILFKNFITPFVSALWGLIQLAGSIIAFAAIGLALDKMEFKRKIDNL